MTILGPKLVSSETREGFLGSTIDSIFWQVWKTFLSIFQCSFLFFIVWACICILSIRIRLWVTLCPLHMPPPSRDDWWMWFFPDCGLQSEQADLSISKWTFIHIVGKSQFHFQEISVRGRHINWKICHLKGKYRSELVITGIWAFFSLSLSLGLNLCFY